MAGVRTITLLCFSALLVLGSAVPTLGPTPAASLSYRPASTLRPQPGTSSYGATVTSSASLTCTSGSTAKETTECTYGHTYTICYSPPATIVCTDGYYPGVFNPVRCIIQSTCYPIPTTTQHCETDGFTVASTATLFNGVLNNGSSTRIESLICGCSGQYSYTTKPYTSFCLPTGSCESFLIAKTSSFSYTVSGDVTTKTNVNCYCPTSSTRRLPC